MKVLTIKKKTIVLCVAIFLFIVTICSASTSFGMQHYYKLDFATGLVTASKLNVRSGPGLQYPVIATVNKNEYIRVFAGIGNWYVVQIEGDYVGVVSQQYVKAIYPNTSGNTGSTGNSGSTGNTDNSTNTSALTADEQEVCNLINQQRTNQGLAALKIDTEVQRVARIKAQEMVDKNYISHTSPTYGSPFDMLNSFKITYKTAGENIAGNSSNSAAVTGWMNSSGHKANILNSQYQYTGIGVVSGSKYGKIYVQIFVGR